MNLFFTTCRSPHRKWVLIVCFSFLYSFAFSQQKVIVTGRVTDGQTPLSNVSVRPVGSRQGTATNDQGIFKIAVNKGQAISISYVGYEEQSLVIPEQSDLNITLKPSTGNTLNDVVVVGYGTTKKVNLTGSVSTVTDKELAGRPITNVSSALQGTMPGVTVTVNNGQPGADQGTIRVRGIGTLGNSDAMVLVDGIVSTMDDVNPGDIETITVLKDAASASIYGSRAANGVILITTKSGKKGDAITHYNMNVGKQMMTATPDFINSWEAATLYNEALVNEGKSPKYSDAEIQKFKDGSDPEHYPNTDWYDLFWKGNGLQQSHSLDVSGGGEKSQSYLSVGYLSQNGLVEGSDLKRYNTRFKTDMQINSRIKLSGNIAYSQEQFREPVSNIHSLDFGQLLGTLNQTGRVVPNMINGYYGYSDEGNPIAVLKGGSNNFNKTHRLSGIFQADIEIVKGLHLKPLLGYTATIVQAKSRINDLQYYDPTTGDPSLWEGPNIVAANTGMTDNLTMQALAQYDKSIGEHDFTILAGYSQEHNKYDYLFGSRRGYLNNALDQLDAGPITALQNGGNAAEYALEIGFRQGQLFLQEKIFIRR